MGYKSPTGFTFLPFNPLERYILTSAAHVRSVAALFLVEDCS